MTAPALPLGTHVLLYHRIAEPLPALDGAPSPFAGMVVSPADLEAHVLALRALGYRFVTAGELARLWRRGVRPPAGLAVITFDDGWADSLTAAAPLLHRLGVRATFYVCPGGFGNPHPRFGAGARIMTEREARSLHDAGMELASHSISHPELPALSDRALRRELRDSRRAVESIIGEACLTLAYPTGLHDARVRRAAAEAGYELAFAAAPGRWSRLAAPRVQAPCAGSALLLRRLGLEAPSRRERAYT